MLFLKQKIKILLPTFYEQWEYLALLANQACLTTTTRARARVKLRIPSSLEWQKNPYFYLFGSADLDFGPL